MSDPFSARFPGTCAACGERYPTATSIRRADDTDDRALRHPTGECDRD